MKNNFNTLISCSNSEKLAEVHKEKLNNEASLRARQEYLSQLDIDPNFKDGLELMLNEINAELVDIMECKFDILARDKQIKEAEGNVIPLESRRKRPVFEEMKQAAA